MVNTDSNVFKNGMEEVSIIANENSYFNFLVIMTNIFNSMDSVR